MPGERSQVSAVGKLMPSYRERGWSPADELPAAPGPRGSARLVRISRHLSLCFPSLLPVAALGPADAVVGTSCSAWAQGMAPAEFRGEKKR